MKILGVVLPLALGLSACAYTQEPTTIEPGSQVGGTGNVGYSHEALGNNKHMIVVTAAPGLMETEGSIAQRILASAYRIASGVCPQAFEFLNDPNMDQTTAGGFMKRTRTFVFLCKV